VDGIDDVGGPRLVGVGVVPGHDWGADRCSATVPVKVQDGLVGERHRTGVVKGERQQVVGSADVWRGVACNASNKIQEKFRGSLWEQRKARNKEKPRGIHSVFVVPSCSHEAYAHRPLQG
jgi:hypothetical protein